MHVPPCFERNSESPHMKSDYPYALIQFYTTAPYACSYLSGHVARSQVATPSHLIDTQIYSELVRNGFRRSGTFTYRPHCDNCRACVPVRVPVMQARTDRSQRRALKQHMHLLVTEHPLQLSEEHFALYQRYQSARHIGGGMDLDNHEQYTNFLLQTHVDTHLLEFRENDVLRMVCVIDQLADGLSSVYTYFDPDQAHASYGTYGVLWQIEACRRLELPYLYLGYWIRDSDKMAYKSRFKPIEGRIDGQWQPLDPVVHHQA